MTLARGTSSGGFIQESGTTAHGLGGGGFINESSPASTLNTRTVATRRSARTAVGAGRFVTRSVASRPTLHAAETAGPIRAETISGRAGRLRSAVTQGSTISRTAVAQAGRLLGQRVAGPFKTQSISTWRSAAASSATSVTRVASAHILAGNLVAASSVVEELQRGVVARPRKVAGAETSEVSRVMSVSGRGYIRTSVERGTNIIVTRSVSSHARVSAAMSQQPQRQASVTGRAGKSRGSSTFVHTHQESLTTRPCVRSVSTSQATRLTVQSAQFIQALTQSAVEASRYVDISGLVRAHGQVLASRFVGTTVSARHFIYARLISGRYAMGRLCVADLLPYMVSLQDSQLGAVEAKDEVFPC